MALSICLVLLPVLVCLGILAVAIYEHVTAAALSLPMAHGLTGVIIALPIIALFNAAYLILSRQYRHQQQQQEHLQQQLHQQLQQQPGTPAHKSLTWTSVQYGAVRIPSLPATLQLLQGVLSIVVATLLIANNIVGGSASSASSPSPLIRCALETTWQRLWSAHDAAALRRIQDALNCCGFNSVVDRAWPFPHGAGSATCAESYDRSTACRVPWMQTVQRRAGVELAMVVVVGLFQVGTLLARDWPLFGFSRSQRREYRENGDQQGVRRPLLQDRPSVAYVDDVEEADGAGAEAEAGAGAIAAGESEQRRDDGLNGPRLEPSGLQNEWTS